MGNTNIYIHILKGMKCVCVFIQKKYLLKITESRLHIGKMKYQNNLLKYSFTHHNLIKSFFGERSCHVLAARC